MFDDVIKVNIIVLLLSRAIKTLLSALTILVFGVLKYTDDMNYEN